jgi:hypothetical protein
MHDLVSNIGAMHVRGPEDAFATTIWALVPGREEIVCNLMPR